MTYLEGVHTKFQEGSQLASVPLPRFRVGDVDGGHTYTSHEVLLQLERARSHLVARDPIFMLSAGFQQDLVKNILPGCPVLPLDEVATFQSLYENGGLLRDVGVDYKLL